MMSQKDISRWVPRLLIDSVSFFPHSFSMHAEVSTPAIQKSTDDKWRLLCVVIEPRGPRNKYRNGEIGPRSFLFFYGENCRTVNPSTIFAGFCPFNVFYLVTCHVRQGFLDALRKLEKNWALENINVSVQYSVICKY